MMLFSVAHSGSPRNPLKSPLVAGAAGVALVIVGLVPGGVAYDKKYFPEGHSSEPSRVWEGVGAVGFLSTITGVLLVLISFVGVIVVAIASLFGSSPPIQTHEWGYRVLPVDEDVADQPDLMDTTIRDAAGPPTERSAPPHRP